ncbi:LamG-like jellyroll fold domain-containing protein [Roseibium sp. Sym1]|uniref:LamG-like jellyroll fold domain-containing protein n=1 Tax=Roseibium sp. Sym1 TaxID=3016006 RepID=UPI0022B2E024|nr:LamG-like jellyroll fold domain-containing protein [Roseibium sp. Sym1]
MNSNAASNILAPVFSLNGSTSFSGERGDYLDAGNPDSLNLAAGTVALTFNADHVWGSQALFSKDGSGYDDGGHLTVWIDNGRLVIRQQDEDSTEYLKVPDLHLSANTDYHLAVTFGEDGLQVYVNGQLLAAEPEFKQGIDMNERSLLVGASGAWRKDDAHTAHQQFKGSISDVMVFDEQLAGEDMAALAGEVDPAFEDAALAALAQDALMPAFQQVDQASAELKALATAYGFNEDGELTTGAATQQGTDAGETLNGTDDADAIDAGLGNDIVNGGGGNDVLQGGYGNDDLNGGDGDDVLDGGHGEDVLNGGAGNDLLISRSDGREGPVAYDPDRDEGDPLNELTNGKLYPDQPIPADDVLTGGSGGDIFYFQTLINAKQRFIEEHTRDDGTIRWNGVAGENANIHDHWVDQIGHDTITDFNREDGDRIVIEGHTTKIRSITYGDSNGDGVVDHTVISLYSDQGRGGGAHNNDDLGTITVYGDLVTQNDISTTSRPAYGIVRSIADLEEALKPIEMGEERTGTPPLPDLPGVDDLPLPAGMTPVFAIAGDTEFSGERGDYLEAGNPDSLDLANGTIALTFNADKVSGGQALFSKDGSGYDNGGHITAYLCDNKIYIRQQSDSSSEYLKVQNVEIAANTTYHLAVTFGEDGLQVFLNGELVAAEPEFKQGLDMNERSLVIGASGAWRKDDAHTASQQFDGTISDVMVFDEQLAGEDMAALAGEVDPAFEDAALAALAQDALMPAFQQVDQASAELKALATAYGFNEDGELTTGAATQQGTDAGETLNGTDDADAIDAGLGNDIVNGGGGNDVLQGGYGNDDLNGGDGDDVLDGGHGEDVLNGGAGNDLLISRSDGREGPVAHDPDRDEGDPLNELTNGKLYPDQPIPADDVLTGGSGGDIFYFQTLINAKQRFIEEHTRDDGTIRWNGVAGENANIHDHWVDQIGHDTITDFNREDGDRIVIEGHTTKIRSITYGDSNGDGVVDHTVISLYSDQGRGGGAHNNDDLGTITVYGDLVTQNDISTTSRPAYGIVRSIADLEEALKPIEMGEERTGTPPLPDLPGVDDLPLPAGMTPVFAIAGDTEFSGERGDYLEAGNPDSLDLANGTIALTFNADKVSGGQALFSKDGSGYDNGGHITAYLCDNKIYIRQQSDSSSEYLKVQNVEIAANTTYHLAVTFGEDGLQVFLNGELVAAEPEFKQGLDMNERSLVIGASGAWRKDDAHTASQQFDGTISDVMVFDEQLAGEDMAALAGEVDPAFEDAALAALAQDALMPAFQQVDQASAELKALATAYGFNEDGELTTGAATQQGTDAGETLNGTDDADAIDAGLGNDIVNGGGGNDVLQGGYGNDDLNGGDGDDVLDGGHGEDVLNGGAGNDLLISRSDGREGPVAYDPDRDEGDPLNELTNGKLYPDQPIPADDVLTGGSGGDIFYFQTLINAKQRFIEEHTRDDGTIRWNGVAGENANIHDHWVDQIGHDTITDFNREDGDRIVIEGHTTKIRSITYGDSNGDGVVDHTVISLYSDQGSGGGAHNNDDLGTITVYGDLVTKNDISTTSKPAYGIVRSIADLEEALKPIEMGEERTGTPPLPDLPGVDDLPLPAGMTPVFAIAGDTEFSGERGDYLDAGNPDSLNLAAGTVALTFNADHVWGSQALFSKDGSGYDDGGHLTVWIDNGRLVIRQQDEDSTEYLKVPDLHLSANTDYHLAVTFGEDGLQVYVNGQLLAAEPEFKQGIDMNERSLLVGASGAWRKDDAHTAHQQFKGSISDVMVFDEQLAGEDMAALAGEVDPAFEDAALAALAQDALMPAFQQVDQASAELKALATAYGFNEDGELTTGAATQQGTDAGETLNGTDDADAIDAGLGNDIVNGGGGNDVLQGGYGNDDLNGGDGDDVLDGGHGEDVLNGGAGNDLLISRSDGREGPVAYDPDRDEGDPLNELTNGKLYPDQPIPADDVLTGGSGGDIFYFQTLINAKQRFIEEHTRDDGTIRWNGVAGENANIHDHWVDQIGHDTITDFNREDGDRIVIEGHTTKIRSITYGDSNGDGVVDHTVISLYSDQGSGGGAHNNDDLGTITVYGDLVTKNDISTTSKPAYGIVRSIADLEEALKPIEMGEERTGTPPLPDLPGVGDLPLPAGMTPVFAIAGDTEFSGERGDYLDAGNPDSLDLANGTIALTFNADKVSGGQALFSKDGSGYDNGGHITAYLCDNKIYIRQQSDSASEYLKVQNVEIAANTAYHLAVTFGEDGLKVFLNGELVAAEPEFKQGLDMNERSLVIGASGAWRKDDAHTASQQFDGTISDVMVFDEQLAGEDMAALAGEVDPAFEDAALAALAQDALMPAFQQVDQASAELKALATAYGFNEDGELTTGAATQQGTDAGETLNGTDDADAIDAGLGNDIVNGGGGNDVLQGGYGNDDLNGGDGDDVLDGGHGEDVLNGGAGNDLLISRSDGREGPVAHDPDRDEGDPLNELTNGKLYPDQPIPADDVLTGGSGGDIFYFQTLINAKQRFIEEHTRDDGTIRWNGVAGENANIHDHWVDQIGHDTITDFNREDGDRIVIEGHTTKIRSITYGDSNGDGVVDHTVIALYSDQGRGGGAHNNDDLGTITVYGDLVTKNDISTTSKPAYGIVRSIADLEEALKPIEMGEERTGTPPLPDLPGVDDLPLPAGTTPVFAIAGALELDGTRDNQMAIAHDTAMEISEGTIAFSFNANRISGYDALFSKDASGYGTGGHLTAWVTEWGDVKIRFQTETSEIWLKAHDVVEAGTEHDFAFTFGDDGIFLFIDGVEVASDEDFRSDWLGNEEYLMIGANGWGSPSGEIGWTNDHFDGDIFDFRVLDEQLSADQIGDSLFV